VEVRQRTRVNEYIALAEDKSQADRACCLISKALRLSELSHKMSRLLRHEGITVGKDAQGWAKEGILLEELNRQFLRGHLWRQWDSTDVELVVGLSNQDGGKYRFRRITEGGETIVRSTQGSTDPGEVLDDWQPLDWRNLPDVVYHGTGGWEAQCIIQEGLDTVRTHSYMVHRNITNAEQFTSTMRKPAKVSVALREFARREGCLVYKTPNGSITTEGIQKEDGRKYIPKEYLALGIQYSIQVPEPMGEEKGDEGAAKSSTSVINTEEATTQNGTVSNNGLLRECVSGSESSQSGDTHQLVLKMEFRKEIYRVLISWYELAREEEIMAVIDGAVHDCFGLQMKEYYLKYQDNEGDMCTLVKPTVWDYLKMRQGSRMRKLFVHPNAQEEEGDMKKE